MSAYEPRDTTIEALRRANPVPAAQTAGRRALPSAHALFADVIAQPPRRERRLRRPVLVIAIAILLIILLLAAFIAVRRDHASVPGSVACYATADLGARRVVESNQGDPARACANAWSLGRFGPRRVPDLDVCVLPSGVPAAFPGESGSVCARLGLPAASASAGDKSANRFADALVRRVTARCIGRDEAERIVRSELARERFTDWKIEFGDSEFDADRPCASLAVELAKRTITIIPVANPFVPPPSTAP